MSSPLRFGVKTVPQQEEAGEYQAAGVDLVIVNLPQPFSPTILEPLAEALSGLNV